MRFVILILIITTLVYGFATSQVVAAFPLENNDSKVPALAFPIEYRGKLCEVVSKATEVDGVPRVKELFCSSSADSVQSVCINFSQENVPYAVREGNFRQMLQDLVKEQKICDLYEAKSGIKCSNANVIGLQPTDFTRLGPSSTPGLCHANILLSYDQVSDTKYLYSESQGYYSKEKMPALAGVSSQCQAKMLEAVRNALSDLYRNHAEGMDVMSQIKFTNGLPADAELVFSTLGGRYKWDYAFRVSSIYGSSEYGHQQIGLNVQNPNSTCHISGAGSAWWSKTAETSEVPLDYKRFH